jgi:hypothetical protein
MTSWLAIYLAIKKTVYLLEKNQSFVLSFTEEGKEGGGTSIKKYVIPCREKESDQ